MTFNQSKKAYEFKTLRPSQWRSLHKISDYLKGAILVSEDWTFYQHSGVDVSQVWTVLKESLTRGHFTRGASTITQQLVKNAYLNNEKTLSRKLKEFYLSLKCEQNVEKNMIFEQYLNMAQFGKYIYGVEKASQFYFGVSSMDINPKQAAFLAMLLPSPIKYASSFDQKRLTPFAEKTIQKILVKMRQGKFLSKDQWEIEKKSSLKFKMP